MEIVLAIVIGVLYGAGVYMILRRSLFKLILGLSLLGHASNLVIFTVGRLTRNAPPLIPEGAYTLAAPYSDPLPQALILTAIVIGFGVQAFAIVLIKRAHRITRVDDFDVLSTQQV
ncbi:Na+/H+ antiporter subunit C [Aggregatilinea lenta]|uniref:Na+/H+ antiporter subunit C n=1 Tax=Aggregatilinea lenta TaxID=913108 RepID=UPI000E5AEB02|nr:Na+/H+ antiporter subunit C [Aggregatilinea lenta]